MRDYRNESYEELYEQLSEHYAELCHTHNKLLDVSSEVAKRLTWIDYSKKKPVKGQLVEFLRWHWSIGRSIIVVRYEGPMVKYWNFNLDMPDSFFLGNNDANFEVYWRPHFEPGRELDHE